MGPAPSLSDYQAAAKAQYEPQLQSDITTGRANSAAKVSNLESSKGQISTNYQSAIQNLQNSVQDQTGRIGQLYTSRLLGNVSGLQGNDMGMMFSKANQQQATIESTRTNALNSISTQEANIGNEQIASESALASRYQGLEAASSSSGYNSALKEYNTQQLEQQKMAQSQYNSDRSYSLSAARLGASQGKASSNAANAAAAGYNLNQGSEGQYMFHDSNGTPISMATYLEGASQGNGQVWTSKALDLLKNGTGYDKQIYTYAKKAYDTHGDVAQAIANADKKNAYGLRK